MESRKMTLTALGLLSTIALTAGCSDDRAQQPPTVVTTTQPTPPPATTYVAPSTNTPPIAGQVNPSTVPTTNNTNAGPGGPTGSELGDKITREIHTNAQMTGSRITAVSNSAGTVRLTGRAQHRQQKALAAKTAKDEPGTTSVVNKIEIVPTGGVKEAAAQPKTIVKTVNRYFYIHDNNRPGSTSTSTGNVDNDDTAMPGSSKHPMNSNGSPGPDSSVDSNSNM